MAVGYSWVGEKNPLVELSGLDVKGREAKVAMKIDGLSGPGGQAFFERTEQFPQQDHKVICIFLDSHIHSRI